MDSFMLRQHRKYSGVTEPSKASSDVAPQPFQGVSPVQSHDIGVRPEEEIHHLAFFQEQRAALQQGFFERPSTHEKNSIFLYVMMVLLLLGITVVGWFIYFWWAQPALGLPPVLSADIRSYRVRPENPGGLVIPHQDKLIYNQLSGQAPALKEQLLPPPEELITPAYEQQEVSEAAESSEFYEAYLPPPDQRASTPFTPTETHARPSSQVIKPEEAGIEALTAQPPFGSKANSAFSSDGPQVRRTPMLEAAIPSSQVQSPEHTTRPKEKPVPIFTPQTLVPVPLSEELDHQALDALIEDPETFHLEVHSPTKERVSAMPLEEQSTMKSQRNAAEIANAQQAYMVQIGAFSTQSQAQKEIDRLRELQKSVPHRRLMLKPYINSSGQTEYRVFIGTLYNLDEAVQLKAFMKQHYQISESIIVRTKGNG